MMNSENAMTSPPKKNLKGIVFDLDGTLVDSLSLTFDAFNHGIMNQGGKHHTPEELIKYFGTGEGEIFAQIVGPERAEAAYAASRGYLETHIDAVPLHRGIDELLSAVKAADVPVSIFTGRSWNTTEIILKYHHLLENFVTVIANDHVDHPKPSPEGLLLAAERMRMEPSEILFIGDSPVDIRAAHRAGAQGVAATWDLLANREHLKEVEPHHWAEKPQQIWELWRRLSRN
ncbi:MAG: hypothetical protein A2428_17545 [Bdellovibrionales bacterium RIFOXYC1_FULL_54_43]|nr:MAG: hypothetical protein A2428_17545 [Bdellovibrionales bacterium RIFOXYC1_FULL_54_43]OFZ82196.1 MAG: hypothetical protein A2603_12365 [Bdellovibrionales bacterium RIFOXYD1_FULL_55_31]